MARKKCNHKELENKTLCRGEEKISEIRLDKRKRLVLRLVLFLPSTGGGKYRSVPLID